MDLAIALIGDFTEKVRPTQRVDVVNEDPTDNRILECAQEGRSYYMVTRDKHVLKLKEYGPTKIVLAADFLQNMREQGRNADSGPVSPPFLSTAGAAFCAVLSA